MSSQHPILGNRPIDQWKVTELKEELKKRMLTTSGLKNDLIRRLEEALRVERESSTQGVHNGLSMDPQPFKEASNAVGSAGVTELAGDTGYDIGELSEDVEVIEEVHNVAKETEMVDNVVVQQDRENSAIAISEAKPQDEIIVGDISSRVEEEFSVHATAEHSGNATTDGVVSEELLFAQVALSSGTLDVNEKIKSEESKDRMLNEDLKPRLENEGLKFPHEDPTVESSAPTKQVSEVSPNLGFPVKSDSITTDSVSINEKIELKDNIIDDNVKLELDVVKQESVEPSLSNVVPVGGESHPMDVEEPQEKKASVEEEDSNNAIHADMSKKIDVVDIGYSEKLNLDRSSGDDSMEEDVMESKQIESKFHSGEMGDGLDNGKALALKEGDVDIVGRDILTEQNETHGKNLMNQALPAEKRKHHEFVRNAEMLKRQRRWNSEGLKIPEPHTLHHAPTVTPKDTIQPAHLRRNFSRCDSSIGEDAPKERVVPPSPKPPTDSLRIDHFLRPFTLKAVQELLGKTGTVKSFWMDQIKTHCYVTYSSVDEAIETRNAVYNLQWPSNGGHLLVAEFVHPQEVKLRVEAPQDSPAPVTPTAAIIPTTAPPIALLQASPRKQVSMQQLPPPPLLPPPLPLSNPPPVKDRLGLSLPPLPPEKHDPPIITLDDLFWKTKTTPRIYYLPLSEERVAVKLAQQTKNAKR